MNKNLIINKLNKCKAYEYKQKPIFSEDSCSKISTSTKTQQSPTPYILNPQFTFKANKLNSVVNKKSKAEQFFESINYNNQVIYQKVVLMKSKPVERSLEFQLINLRRQDQKYGGINVNKRLHFPVQNDTSGSTKYEVQQSIRIKNQKNRELPQSIKTQYIEGNCLNPYFYNNNEIPYDSKKYKLSRQNQGPRQCRNQNYQAQRWHTEADNYEIYPAYSGFKQSEKQVLNYECQGIQQKQFNNYQFDQNKAVDHDIENRDSRNSRQSMLQKPSRKLSNSSRLTLFRKQRQYQLRKSLLQQNDHKSRRQNYYYSNDNKQNQLSGNLRYIPLNSSSQGGQNRLKAQLSQRYLLGKKHFEQEPTSRIYCIQGKATYLDKVAQGRVRSIRKQFRQDCQGKQKQNQKLKIMRDQQIYQNNAKNSLRRVGSICRF